VWHAHIPDVHPGQHYGIRADGPWDPDAGLVFNPNKLLLDPYARAIDETPRLGPELFSHEVDDNLASRNTPRTPDQRDSSRLNAHAIVVNTTFDWGDTARPHIPWEQTFLYEAHVRNLTRQHPDLPEDLRGTYAGLAHPAVIEHLTSLGVTSVELLPIHAAMTEAALTSQGKINAWGYSTLAFFAPDPRHASAAARAAGPQAVMNEVKGMVKLLHAAGIEVILDVVYNHTCESGSLGPTVCWRGLDNLTWYAHDDETPIEITDVTGCGNSLDFRHPEVIQMTLDSLRYWANEYHIDGFRYDLAVTLARGQHGFSPDHPFLVAVKTDPVLQGLKHIAEPWDIGPDGWQTGGFPLPFAAWNDRFRDDARSFWLANPRAESHGHPGVSARDLATRLSGSADLFASQSPGRTPLASVNYIASHDGFSLTDLVTYDQKHNRENGEDNRDGHDDNRSWNHGREGPILGLESDAIVHQRRTSERNLLATLAFAAGVPMIAAGDEMGRTQRGNNNAYCLDSPVTWINWRLEPWQRDLLATTAAMFRLRSQHPALRPTQFFTGNPKDDGVPDLAWYDAAGQVVGSWQWDDSSFRTLQMLRRGPAPGDRDALLVINGRAEPASVMLAPPPPGLTWELVGDSAKPTPEETPAGPTAPEITLSPLSLRLFLSTA